MNDMIKTGADEDLMLLRRAVGERATHWVYILANRRNGVLFIGTTRDLPRRISAQRNGRGAAFARAHRTTRLVYAQELESGELAAQHKKRLEKWPRAWTLRMIDRHNPGWRDLYPSLAG